MNNPVENYRSSWSPSPAGAILSWLLVLGLVITVTMLFRHGDAPGALLTTGALMGACFAGCYTSFARPRLAAGDAGIRVRTLGGSYELGWDDVEISTVTTRRRGRPSHTLEIDAGEQPPHLLVLGRVELAADPADVRDTLDELRRHS